MATAILISSHVAAGAVGLKANIAALNHGCVDWVALPTTLLSGHPARPHHAGAAVDPALLTSMIEALDAEGVLASCDAALFGYMPSAAHVAVAVALAQRLRKQNPDATLLVDPIIGDTPKGLYVQTDVAEAIRDNLLPLADIATPNAFELHWLTGRSSADPQAAAVAAKRLSPAAVVVTVVPYGQALLANVLVTGDEVCCTTVNKLERVPHGVGDLFAGLLVAELAANATLTSALGFATAVVDQTLAASHQSEELQVHNLPNGGTVRPIRVEPLPLRDDP